MNLAATLCGTAVQHPANAAEHETAPPSARCRAYPRSAASRATSASFGRSASRSRIPMPTPQRRSGAISRPIPPEAGLVEMSAQYGVDFSTAKAGMRLADFADDVRAQKGNLGSFDELLKTTDPNQSLQEFARRFLVDRILVAAGTPKKHCRQAGESCTSRPAPTAASSWAAAIRPWTTSGSLSNTSCRNCSAGGLSKKKYAGADAARKSQCLTMPHGWRRERNWKPTFSRRIRAFRASSHS